MTCAIAGDKPASETAPATKSRGRFCFRYVIFCECEKDPGKEDLRKKYSCLRKIRWPLKNLSGQLQICEDFLRLPKNRPNQRKRKLDKLRQENRMSFPKKRSANRADNKSKWIWTWICKKIRAADIGDTSASAVDKDGQSCRVITTSHQSVASCFYVVLRTQRRIDWERTETPPVPSSLYPFMPKYALWLKPSLHDLPFHNY